MHGGSRGNSSKKSDDHLISSVELIYYLTLFHFVGHFVGHLNADRRDMVGDTERDRLDIED